MIQSWKQTGARVAAGLLALHCGVAIAQFHHRPKPRRVMPSKSLTFIRQDGSCVTGPIANIDPKAVAVAAEAGPGTQAGPVTIERPDLLQVSQRDSLVYSARSSWADVQAVHLRLGENFEVKLHNGGLRSEVPLAVTAQGLVYKRFLWLKTRVPKAQVVTVDYLRRKPDSDAFDYFTQTAPALLFFYPEFYDRLKGLEGRIPVRLYDVLRPQDDKALRCAGQ